MLTGPVPVTEKILKDSGMTIGDIDLFEVNEAFAAVVLRFMQAFDVDHGKVNVNGGAIAMGHPLGATGAMIIGTLLDELERSDKEVGPCHALHRVRHGAQLRARWPIIASGRRFAWQRTRVERDDYGQWHRSPFTRWTARRRPVSAARRDSQAAGTTAGRQVAQWRTMMILNEPGHHHWESEVMNVMPAA